MKRRPRAGAALAVAAWSIMSAGCGPGGGDAATPDGATPRVAIPTEGVFGQAPLPFAGVPSVITLQPHGPVEVEWPELATIDQLGLQFSPSRLLVPVGQPVRFHNSETLAHNVHIQSVATGATLLNADSPPDESVTFVFDEGGGYDILCDIHPGMTAFVFATAAPYAAITDEEGTFHIEDVLPGDYTLYVWSADPEQRTEQTVVVRAGTATEVQLTPLG